MKAISAIVTDCSSNFNSALFRTLISMLTIKQAGILDRNPRANGTVERRMKLLKSWIKKVTLIVLWVITKNRVIITNHGEYWPLFFF